MPYTIAGHGGRFERRKNAIKRAKQLVESTGRQCEIYNSRGQLVATVQPGSGSRGAPRHNGVYDPNILKAVFLAGGPGSGKSYTASSLFGVPKGLGYAASGSTGLKLVNSDPAFEHFLREEGISPADLAKMTPAQFRAVTEGPRSPRGRASRVKKAQQAIWEKGRLGLILDGTGDDFAKIKKRRAHLESLGYDTFMVFVNTSLEVAQERNAARDRKLPRSLVREIWTNVQNNLGRFQGLFGARDIVIVDNTVYGPIPAEISKCVEAFLRRPIENRIGRQWVRDEMARQGSGATRAGCRRGL